MIFNYSSFLVYLIGGKISKIHTKREKEDKK